MFLYYKQAHKTHLLLISENDSMIKNWEALERIENLSRLGKIQNRLMQKHKINTTIPEKPGFGIAVDAWCVNHLQGPGPCGYRGVDIETGEVLFGQNHLGNGTNNIAEFLAIIHGLMYCKKHGKHNVVYSDSEIAIAWIKAKKSNSGMNLDSNPELKEKLWHAEMWLVEQKRLTHFAKWETKHWGEIPADFGRK